MHLQEFAITFIWACKNIPRGFPRIVYSNFPSEDSAILNPFQFKTLRRALNTPVQGWNHICLVQHPPVLNTEAGKAILVQLFKQFFAKHFTLVGSQKMILLLIRYPPLFFP